MLPPDHRPAVLAARQPVLFSPLRRSVEEGLARQGGQRQSPQQQDGQGQRPTAAPTTPAAPGTVTASHPPLLPSTGTTHQPPQHEGPAAAELSDENVPPQGLPVVLDPSELRLDPCAPKKRKYDSSNRPCKRPRWVSVSTFTFLVTLSWTRAQHGSACC
jgi:hypothetical protein